MEELDWENMLVLNLVQALVGAIPSSMLGVSISCNFQAKSVGVYFAVRDRTSDLDELIDEIATDLEGLTGGDVLIQTHVWVGHDWATEWPGRELRLVFALRR